MSHVAQDREHSEACKDASATVQGTESDAISVGTEDIRFLITYSSKADVQRTKQNSKLC